MANIRVTPEELNTQGADLKQYAEDLEGILTNIGNKITEITNGWDGLAQDAYFEMYTTMNESLKQFPVLVDSLGEATIGAANAFAAVDDELKNTFSQS